MDNKPQRLVVIGGVAAGTSAASRARRTDGKMDIVIYEKGDYVSYGACDEPYFIGGEISSWENLLVRAPEEFESRQNIKIRLRHEVTSINAESKTVTVLNHETGQTFETPWDRLIIATGAKPRKLNCPGENLPGIFQLKFLPQAKAIKEFIENHKPRSAVIIGAGLIALEMAEALTANNIDVTICNRSNNLGFITDSQIADQAIETLKSNGVRYSPNCKVIRFEPGNSKKVHVVITDQGAIETDMVLICIGVIPEVEMAKTAGITTGQTGAISTNFSMETNIKRIFAAGDCCQTVHRISNEPIFAPLGDIANKQGWVAGENAAGGNAQYKGCIGSAHFRVFDLEIGTTGLTGLKAEKHFDMVTQTIQQNSRAHAQPKGVKITVNLVVDKKSRKLIGAQTAGTEGAAHRINTLAVCVHNQMTIDQMNELDFAYAPPFSPVIDPILLAARVMLKKI